MIELIEADFKKDVLESKIPVLVEFYRAEGCQPCKDMIPVVEQFAKEHPEILVCKADPNTWSEDFKRKYFLQRSPTFFSFSNGQIITKRIGSQTVEQLLKMFDKNQARDPQLEQKLMESKARGYDLIRTAEKAQHELRQVNENIEKMEQQLKQ